MRFYRQWCCDGSVGVVLFYAFTASVATSELLDTDSMDCSGHNTSIPRIPLYMLLLLMKPDDRESAGWDDGPSLLAGARVALKDINAKPDFLCGYSLNLIEAEHEACGLSSTTTGVINLVNYAINQGGTEIGPVVAIGGLMCSGITKTISSIAGRQGVDILQLSGANSPYFTQSGSLFPYLWRFLTTAEIFSDLLLAFMNKYQWGKVAVVYDGESVYYSAVADTFRQAIKDDLNKSIIVENSVMSTEDIYFEQAVSDIIHSKVRIIFTFLDRNQNSKLLCMAEREGLVHPNYQWIVVDDLPEFVDFTAITTGDCSILNGGNHTFFTNFHLYHNLSQTIVSGKSYRDYREAYHSEVESIRAQRRIAVHPDPYYAAIVYDQLWTLALALNSTLPILKRENLSIEQYSYGQSNITMLLQRELSKVRFTGASSDIHFNENKEVFNVVDIFHIDENGVKLVGVYNSSQTHKKLHLFDINEQETSDEWDPDTTVLPVYATVLLFAADSVVIIFVTHILVLFFLLRKKPSIKASSPGLSILMFIGCYLLCFSAYFVIVRIGFAQAQDHGNAMCSIHYVLFLNGIALIFITLLLRLLRIYKIFNNKRLSQLSEWTWSNGFLLAIIAFLCLFLNVLLVVWLVINPVIYSSTIKYQLDGNILTAERIAVCTGENMTIWIGVLIGLLAVIMLCILFVSIKTRKIRYNNFKDTKKVNSFLALLIITSSVSVTLAIIFQGSDTYYFATTDILYICFALLIPVASQLFLFMPKLYTASCASPT